MLYFLLQSNFKNYNRKLIFAIISIEVKEINGECIFWCQGFVLNARVGTWELDTLVLESQPHFSWGRGGGRVTRPGWAPVLCSVERVRQSVHGVVGAPARALLLSKHSSCFPLSFFVHRTEQWESVGSQALRNPKVHSQEESVMFRNATWSEKSLLRCFYIIDKVTCSWCWNNPKVIRDILLLVPSRCCCNYYYLKSFFLEHYCVWGHFAVRLMHITSLCPDGTFSPANSCMCNDGLFDIWVWNPGFRFLCWIAFLSHCTASDTIDVF